MSHRHSRMGPIAPRSEFYQGPFGRICPDLSPWTPPVPPDQVDTYLQNIANTRMTEAPGRTPGEITANPDEAEALDAQFSSNIPAGYTYFGQFVDHDITFDPASSLMRQNDPGGLLNFRTPRLDLDNIYGRGPDDQPYLYDPQDKAKLAIGVSADPSLPDLPRFQGRALIGDMRNDENAIVSQLQLAFMLAHNTLVDNARAAGTPEHQVFEEARRCLRWLYQHVVWNDFVSRLVDRTIHASALHIIRTFDRRMKWVAGLEDIYKWKRQPFIPVEFSVAAYRFGHSMVRNAYQTNAEVRGFGRFAPVFDVTTGSEDDLRGFRPMKPDNMIQWDWFLPMTTSRGPFPQMARKIDSKLANALLHLPDEAEPMNVLAFRNMKRGLSFELPTGEDIAAKFGISKIILGEDEPKSLWYYILREAEVSGGDQLGRLGGLIVAAVFSGLLKGDPNSWVNVKPLWKPSEEDLLKAPEGQDPYNVDDEKWSLASIIRLAGLKSDGLGFASREEASPNAVPTEEDATA